MLNNLKRSFSRLKVSFRKKTIEPFDVPLCLGGEPNTKAHSFSLCAFSIERKDPITSSFEAYRPDDFAASLAANPRAINSLCVFRRSICSRKDVSTKALKDSPSCNTLSASWRNCGVTRSEGIVDDFIAPPIRIACAMQCTSFLTLIATLPQLLLVYIQSRAQPTSTTPPGNCLTFAPYASRISAATSER